MCWKWPPFASRQDWTWRAIFWKVLVPVHPLSLPEFLWWYLLSRRLWFVVCFGKLSLSDIPKRCQIRRAWWPKYLSKWRGRQKRTEFRPCWHVKCGMSLHPAVNIQLRVPHHPIPHFTCQHGEIHSLFGDRIISKGLWQPRSPDLTPPAYFLWGYLKGRVYRNKPWTIDALKANITEEIQAVTAARTSKYGAPPNSILSGHKWWPLPAYVMMSSHFLHSEVSPIQISLQYPH